MLVRVQARSPPTDSEDFSVFVFLLHFGCTGGSPSRGGPVHPSLLALLGPETANVRETSDLRVGCHLLDERLVVRADCDPDCDPDCDLRLDRCAHPVQQLAWPTIATS